VVATADLSFMVAKAKLTLVVAVVAVELYAVVVTMTQVAAVVVAVIEVAAVAVTSPNWKIQILSRQTQCPACAIGCDNNILSKFSFTILSRVFQLASMMARFYPIHMYYRISLLY
jgi:hypothetical protein